MSHPIFNIYHPATLQLLQYRSKAKLRRIASSFRDPRRQLLAAVAVILGIIWLSQAVATVMFRQPASREYLVKWIPIGLSLYAGWHLIKTVSKKTVKPFEWTSAEDEFVRAAPVTRHQLVSYRLASLLNASALKAFCFSIVMIPDLSIWLAGFVGMLLALIFVELLRVCFELAFYGLSKKAQIFSRSAILATVVGVLGWVVIKCMMSSNAESDIASPGALLFLKSMISELISLASTPLAEFLVFPLSIFSQVILIDGTSKASIFALPAAFGLVGALTALVYRLDHWMLQRTSIKEKNNFEIAAARTESHIHKITQHRRVRVPARIKGFGSIAWRQLLGAYHHRMTLIISLGLPTLLCCIPMLANHNPVLMLINVVGGVVFYSFLLLPSALMLDFRRDIGRMSVLKSLPITPIAMTLGQLAAPVLICSLFQWGVLLFATGTGSVVAWQAIMAAFLLVPVNVLIFATENFIFMVAPFRQNQEGVDVFLRTILTFTAKGVCFVIALVGTIAWALAARFLATQYFEIIPSSGPLIFGLGIWLITCIAAIAFVLGIARLYRNFDPSMDMPTAG